MPFTCIYLFFYIYEPKEWTNNNLNNIWKYIKNDKNSSLHEKWCHWNGTWSLLIHRSVWWWCIDWSLDIPGEAISNHCISEISKFSLFNNTYFRSFLFKDNFISTTWMLCPLYLSILNKFLAEYPFFVDLHGNTGVSWICCESESLVPDSWKQRGVPGRI